jgi:hypothetical protein
MDLDYNPHFDFKQEAAAGWKVGHRPSPGFELLNAQRILHLQLLKSQGELLNA